MDFFNFGPNASHMMAVCETADVIIVEVNENMPRCLGGFEEGIHISRVDYIVEGQNPAIGELGAGAPPTEVDRAVAQLYCRGDSRRSMSPAWYWRNA